MKSRMMWAEHVICMKEMRNVYKIGKKTGKEEATWEI
jgi:hypothetical protein